MYHIFAVAACLAPKLGAQISSVSFQRVARSEVTPLDQSSHAEEESVVAGSSTALRDDATTLVTQAGVEAAVGNLQPSLEAGKSMPYVRLKPNATFTQASAKKALETLGEERVEQQSGEKSIVCLPRRLSRQS